MFSFPVLVMGVMFVAPWQVQPAIELVAVKPAPVVVTRTVSVKRKAKRPPRRIVAMRAALKQVGVWYKWGGTTVRGFDCSGLIQYAWRQAGVLLPRVTTQQLRVGRAVLSRASIRAGDLLFPSTGHVQMAVGRGLIVEAARRGTRVRVQPMRSRYIAVRRPN
jgi:cell wall-associated NlpC family hydrolase